MAVAKAASPREGGGGWGLTLDFCSWLHGVDDHLAALTEAATGTWACHERPGDAKLAVT